MRRAARRRKIARTRDPPASAGPDDWAPTEEKRLMTTNNDVLAEYQSHGDPALEKYYPEWVDKMAPDATVEGSMLDGVVVGGEDVRKVVVTIRSFYDWQEFKFVGPYGDNGWIEEYVAEVRGEPLGCVVLIKRNEAGQTQHVMASYRPRTSVVHFARLLAEKFDGTPLAVYFESSES
jgi:hypothetical protein